MDKNGKRDIINQCDNTIKSIDKALDKLSGARGWGVYDTFFKGGLISSVVKHNKINDSKYLVQDVSNNITRLRKQLKNVDIENIDFHETSTLNNIFDIAFDNVIADLFTQNKINNNINNLKKLKSEVENIKKVVNNA